MARGVRYEQVSKGLAEFGRSDEARRLSMDGARVIAEHAQVDNPRGRYSVRPATVVAGIFNERRAGAEVVEERPGNGPARRSLARAAREARR